MWQGGTIANGTANPFKWDYSSSTTWGYMAGGAAIGAATSWMSSATATATTGLLTKAGISQTGATLLGNAVGNSVGTFTNSIAGQALYNKGDIDFDKAIQAGAYGFGGGLGAGLVDLYSPISNSTFPMHHTVKHIARTSAYEIGGNIFSGRPLLEDVSFGLDPGLVLPLTMDMISTSTSILAKKAGLKRGSIDFGSGIYSDVRTESNEYGFKDLVADDITGFGITFDFYAKSKGINFATTSPFLALKFGELNDFNMARINYLRYFKSWWY
jgi:hypothetical protein